MRLLNLLDCKFLLIFRKPNGLDCRRNPITISDNVKIINGHYKGKRGVIKNIFKNQVFLYNQDFVSTNGIFVDKSENIEIMGSELLQDNYNGSGFRVNIRKAPDNLQKSIGLLVRVKSGNWKGYVGVLKRVTDIKVAVELTSKNKTINLDINSIELFEKDSNNNNSNATPRNNYANKTPVYCPQSPSNNVTQSPGWGSNCNYIFNTF
jgi:transcription elongation factor